MRTWLLAGAIVAVSLGCGGADESPTDPGQPPPQPPPGGGTVLATGTLSLPAATIVGTTGDHEAFALTHRLTAEQGATAGQRLVVRLRDLSRPGIGCSSDEPEDGCATIDWSDDPSKPNVPRSGRFENRVTLELTTGVKDFFLTYNEVLVETPALIDPAREHTAIPGAGTGWDTDLPADLIAGGDLRLRFFLTKWLDPAVQIGYEVVALRDSAKELTLICRILSKNWSKPRRGD